MYELGVIFSEENNSTNVQQYFNMVKKNGFRKNPPQNPKNSIASKKFNKRAKQQKVPSNAYPKNSDSHQPPQNPYNNVYPNNVDSPATRNINLFEQNQFNHQPQQDPFNQPLQQNQFNQSPQFKQQPQQDPFK